MKKILAVVLALMSMADLTYACSEEQNNPWMLNADFGMSRYSNTVNHDGQTPVGRFSLGRTLFYIPYGNISIEAGIQNGNTMRLDLPKEVVDVLGGVPIEAQMKPQLDVLIGFKTKPLGNTSITGWLKGGAAYRTLQLDGVSVNDVRHIAPEIQLGFGYNINEQMSFNIGYQSIWGKQPVLTVNPEKETGVLRYIPTQHAVLIGFSYNFM